MNSDDLRPHWASPPGETIRALMAKLAISKIELADRIDVPTAFLAELLVGARRINRNLAERLSSALGGSAQFWIARDLQYVADVSRLFTESPEEQKDWLNQLPTADMAKFGWIDRVTSQEAKLKAVLRFFDVQSVSDWYDSYKKILASVQFRTSQSFDNRPQSVITWLRKGELAAEAIHLKSWSADGLMAAIPALRRLSRFSSPEIFFPRLQEMCAGYGLAVVVTRSPSGCRASGATRFIGGRPLIQLSFRYLSDDHFWFSFFHELGHVILHGEQSLFLEFENNHQEAREVQADKFACDALMDASFREELKQLDPKTDKIVRFAKRANVSAGVVVGQLQHMKRIGYNQLNSLKRRYRWQG